MKRLEQSKLSYWIYSIESDLIWSIGLKQLQYNTDHSIQVKFCIVCMQLQFSSFIQIIFEIVSGIYLIKLDSLHYSSTPIYSNFINMVINDYNQQPSPRNDRKNSKDFQRCDTS